MTLRTPPTSRPSSVLDRSNPSPVLDFGPRTLSPATQSPSRFVSATTSGITTGGTQQRSGATREKSPIGTSTFPCLAPSYTARPLPTTSGANAKTRTGGEPSFGARRSTPTVSPPLDQEDGAEACALERQQLSDTRARLKRRLCTTETRIVRRVTAGVPEKELREDRAEAIDLLRQIDRCLDEMSRAPDLTPEQAADDVHWAEVIAKRAADHISEVNEIRRGRCGSAAAPRTNPRSNVSLLISNNGSISSTSSSTRAVIAEALAQHQEQAPSAEEVAVDERRAPRRSVAAAERRTEPGKSN